MACSGIVAVYPIAFVRGERCIGLAILAIATRTERAILGWQRGCWKLSDGGTEASGNFSAAGAERYPTQCANSAGCKRRR